jgi:biotin operon repressor
MGNIQGNIRALLEQGSTPTQIRRRLHLSRKTIWKHTREYVAQGIIEKVARGVYRKAVKPEMLPPLKPAADVTPPPIMLPHKFGAIFAQVRKPTLIYDEYGKAYEKAPNFYTAQFGKYKTQIWLFSGFEGNTVEQFINSGRKKLIAIAETLSSKYNIALTLDRFYEDIEWVDISKERSKATARGAGIRKGEWVAVAGVAHKYDKHSQNGHIEFNQLPQGSPIAPTTHAEIREKLYSGEYERRFDGLERVIEDKLVPVVLDLTQQIKTHLAVETKTGEVLDKIGKGIDKMGRSQDELNVLLRGVRFGKSATQNRKRKKAGEKE